MKGYIIIFAILTVSCVSQKRMVYIQQKHNDNKETYINHRNDLLIKPFDLLYINVTSLDQQGYNFFTQDKGGMTVTTELLNVISYTVSDSGAVKLPVIGKVKLSGQTLDQAEQTIESNYQNYLNKPSVSIRFVNNLVTILGQVSRPGTYPFQTPHINIFNAIGLAGDITEYGDRRRVTIIREEKNNEIKRYAIDLTMDDILLSDYLYVRPNDVIFIEPLKSRWWGMQRFPFELIFSSITTAILVLSYQSSLSK
jgi:polysaccharide export outer membrane protein